MDLDDQLAVTARGLRKRFGRTEALRGCDLDVPAGTVCALLGPNGAGKTTAVRVLTTLTAPDAGQAWVAGYDVVREPEQVRARIGLVGQSAALDERIGGLDNLRLLGRLHHLPERQVRRRAEELLDRFELREAADRRVRDYSGGMRRRLDLAASLIVSPAVLFLDEPTSGLDPRSRGDVWAIVRDLVAAGTTVVLTTQYLDEADQLADRVVVVDGGQTVAAGTPARLKAGLGAGRVEVVVRTPEDLTATANVLSRFGPAPPTVRQAALSVTVPAQHGSRDLIRAARELEAAGVELADIGLRRPTLDDVFLHLTSQRQDGGTGASEPVEGRDETGTAA